VRRRYRIGQGRKRVNLPVSVPGADFSAHIPLRFIGKALALGAAV